MAERSRVARVLLESPLPQLDRLFDYRIPASLTADAVPGVRVKVPLRSAGRIADGYLVEVVEDGEYSGILSDLDSVISPIPVLRPEVWALARRAADRAAGSASDILRLAIPPRQVRIEKAYLARESVPKAPDIAASTVDNYPEAAVDAIVAGGARVAMDARTSVLPVGESWAGAWAHTAQQLASATLAAGRSVIVVVPDFRDQEQIEATLRAHLPAECIVRWDARQPNADRYRAFLTCLDPTPKVIVGTRSTVYAPAANLGLILIWDDGDPLHGEPLSPYVNSRDAALVRQEQQGCSLVILGHSRSTEVERLVELGWFTAVIPTGAKQPKVIPTVFQSGGDRLAEQARIPSSAWRMARDAIADGPVLVQVARPGYAPRMACVDCDQTARCGNCEGPLTRAGARSAPSCLWCGAIAAQWTCGECGGHRMRSVGIGAARTADELGRAFPGVRIIVADGERPITQVDDRPALVIATLGAEPIAAGGYRAVLLLDGERMLLRESLRVGEDCLRWWSNAIALAAPGAPSLLVGVGGMLATALVTWRQDEFARRELADRRRLRFPPAVRVATVTGSVEAVSAAGEHAGIDPADVLGPVDLPEGGVRSILRFDYSDGAAVAAALRADTVRAATARRRPPGAARSRPAIATLRVRLDDIEPFLDF